jgi:hypothetical protein
MNAGTNIRGKRKRERRKLLTLALVLAVAILSMGTLAYTNFIQDAKNEFIGFVNHGVRIHDDYKEVYNAYDTDKDIYVENYGDSPLLVRIRLDEFYRVGSTILIGDPGAVSTDPSVGWKTYTGTLTGAHVDWKWSYGGQKYYLPTENINNADPHPDNVFSRTLYANDGTPATVGSATAQGPATTSDTRPFTAGDVGGKWTNNIFPTYDLSNNGGHTPDAPYTSKTVEQTLGATVMTMKEWVDAGKNQGAFWIMDTDGWFYWGQTLQSGQATGQLLNKVTLENHALLDNYFYGINAVLQAATWDERNAFETGTDSVTGAPNAISNDAKSLLSVASGIYAFNLTATNASDVGKKFVDEQGTQWRVMNIDESKKQAFLLREQLLDAPAAMGNVSWNSASLKTTLNTTYLDSLGDDLKDRVVDQTTNLMTCQVYNNNTATASTGVNKIFMLSEFDVFGTALRASEATISGASQPLFADAASRIAYDHTGVARSWWMRTCSSTNNNVTCANDTGGMYNVVSTSATIYIRPAMIVDLTVMPTPPPPGP